MPRPRGRPKIKAAPINRQRMGKYGSQAKKLGITTEQYIERGKTQRHCSSCNTWKDPHLFYRKTTFITDVCIPCIRLRKNSGPIIESVDPRYWAPYCSAAKKLGIPIQEYVDHKVKGESFCQVCRNWFELKIVNMIRPDEIRPQVCMECYDQRAFHVDKKQTWQEGSLLVDPDNPEQYTHTVKLNQEEGQC